METLLDIESIGYFIGAIVFLIWGWLCLREIGEEIDDVPLAKLTVNNIFGLLFSIAIFCLGIYFSYKFLTIFLE